MKKRLLLLLLLLPACSFVLKAQNVGINATGNAPDASAMLDISSTNSGLLIPRMSTAQRNAIATPATGLLVYDLNLNAFYYYDGTNWLPFLANTSSTTGGWALTGNAGTNATQNFLGTTDAVDLVFRTNGTDRMRFLAGGAAAINTTPVATQMLTVAGGSSASGINVTTTNTASASYALKANAVSGVNAYAGYVGTTTVAGVSFTNPGGWFGAASGSNVGLVGTSQSPGSSVAVLGLSDTWHGGYFLTTYASANGIFGANNSSGTSAGFGGFFLSNQTGGSGVAGTLAGNSYYGGTGVSGVVAGTFSGGRGVVGNSDNASGIGVAGYTAGASGYGVYGAASGANGIGVYGYTSSSTNGTGYYLTSGQFGVLGRNLWGSNYHAGVEGATYQGDAGNRVSGVIGIFTDATTTWGALAYQNSASTNYALYSTAAGTVGTGRINTNSETVSSIGLGTYGDLMGGWVRGNVYGMNVYGPRYALYVQGKTYTNDVIAQLSSDSTGASRSVNYVPVSTSVDVYAKGTATLSNGVFIVNFDPAYAAMLSANVPVIVTVTPQGECNGLYIAAAGTSGFTVKELGQGSSNVTFSWIAVGTRKGYEQPQTPEELTQPAYDTQMLSVMHNENDTVNAAQGVYWNGQSLLFGAVPQSSPAAKEPIDPRQLPEAATPTMLITGPTRQPQH